MTAEMCMKGALARAEQALSRHPTATYAFGIEGGLEEIGGIWFESGYVAVIPKNHEPGSKVIGWGTSSRMQVSEKIVKELKKGKELGEVMDALSGEQDVGKNQGMFGLLTKGAISREEGYTHGVMFALSRFTA